VRPFALLSLTGRTTLGKRSTALARADAEFRAALLSPALRRLAQVTTIPSAPPILDMCGGSPELTAAVAHPTRARAPRVLLPAGLAVLAVCLAGLFANRFVASVGADQPRGFNIFLVLFSRHELPFIALTALFAVAALACMRDGESEDGHVTFAAPSNVIVGVLALGVLVAGWLASHTLFHQFALSMDEYSAHFQASIFAAGRLTAPVPAAFRGVADGITPIFSTYLPQSGAWTTMYLPVYSALRALFLLGGAEWLINPVLSAGCVVLLAAVARRIWPQDGRRQWLALLLLVTSSQFLVTTGSAYSMPAHLCFNFLWLWLWLRGDRASLVALPLVGVLALGLHNPFPHALFAAPFLIYLVVQRRWRMVAWTGAVYAAGSLYWLHWLEAVQPQAQQGGAGGLLGLFQLPALASVVVHSMNLALVATWQAPVAALGLAAALWRFRSLKHPMRELAYGAVLTFGFYVFFPSAQGHGWGYRYIFPVLGSIALLAADGWLQLAGDLRPRAAQPLLVGGLALALVQLPVRAAEVEATIRPYAISSEYLHSLPVDVVLLPTQQWWYGQDLVRNEPLFGTGPVMVATPNITAEQYEQMMARLGSSVRVHTVPYAELARFGLPPLFPRTSRPATPP
jgi:hypothetical protein